MPFGSGWNAANRPTSESRTIGGSGTAVTSSFSYDAANRLTTLTHQVAGGSGLATYVYGYDNADRLTSEQNAEGTVTYGYDNTNQLTGASGSRAETYTYDSGGNRTMSGYSTGTGNELTAAPGATYTYDNAGNLSAQTNTATHVTTSYTYDYHNRLTGVTVGGTAVATYTYDALGRRIGTDVNGTQSWTVWDGPNPYATFNGSGALQTRYLHGPAIDALLARTDSGGNTAWYTRTPGRLASWAAARTDSGGNTAWYLTDRLGTVRDIANSSGTVLDHLSYNSYGTVLSESSPSNGDQFNFAGMQYDTTTGLYYDNARYYDAVGGRFVSQDPTGFAAGDANLYRYVGNGPTNAIDPGGMAATSPSTITTPTTYDHFLDDYSYYFNNPSAMDPGFMQNAQYAALYTAATAGTILLSAEIAFISASAGMYSVCVSATFATNFVIVVGATGAAIGGTRSALNGDGFFPGMLDGATTASDIALTILPFLNSCFAGGTPILTPEGDRRIEEFQPGDWVLSAPEDDPEATPVPRRVEAVFQRNAVLLKLHIGGKTIRTTAEHPFWVRGRGWTAATDLTAGDPLHSHDGRWMVLEAVERGQETAPVYNLRVAEYHTYFVGNREWEFSVWSHNASFRHYGYGSDAPKFRNGLRPGGYATHARGRPMSGPTAQQKLALPHDQPPDSYYKVTIDPATTPVIGPRPVEPTTTPPRPGGGIENIFPEGTPPGSVTGPFPILPWKRKS